MNVKSLLLIGALALAGIASAKSYDVVLSAPVKAGSAQLAAGAYSLTVKGNNATFTNVETGTSVSTTVKVENATTKFETTTVENTANQIKSIELGGSTTKLELGE